MIPPRPIRPLGFLLAPAVSLFLGGAAANAAKADHEEFFERRIRPVLAEHCYECHSAGATEVKAGLRLDTRAGWKAGGESGPAIEPGDPDASLLIRAIRGTESDFRMPPPDHGAKLPEEAIGDLVQWVRMGAPDPRDSSEVAGGEAKATDGADHWAFQSPEKPSPPEVEDAAWPLNPVDRFIRAEQEERDFDPNDMADPRTLIRRLSFDLVGLPPEPEEIRAFEKAAAKDRQAAVEKLVDRLLASPRFGERWGRHWLDVARFAESSGHERNFAYPHAWRYRDWVIESFNRDKPYDQFVREQIAGDLLPHEGKEEQVDQTVGTGFLALGPKNHLDKGTDQQLELADDRIDTMSRSVLGLTISCARCHDHKYDPISTADYYSLAGIFMSTESLHGTVPGTGGGNNNIPADLFAVKGDGDKARKLQEQRREDRKAAEKKLKEVQKKLGDIPRDDPSEEQQAEIDRLRKEKASLQKRVKKLREPLDLEVEWAMAARDEKEPSDVAVRISGIPGKKGDVAPRGFPDVITHGEAPEIEEGGSGRLAMAEWLTRESNPLTARVMVNRIWQHLFGRGLVSSVDNFGMLGAYPSHPELLDYLAVRFMEEDWSIKSMIRLLATSRTYQLASDHDEANVEQDPDAVWLWRMPPRRLEWEPLRDAMLRVSGQLQSGPPEQGSVVAEMGDGCLERQLDTDPLRESRPWRSVYLPVVRFYAPDMAEVFDGAPATLSIGDRAVTTVPGQALFLLNNELVVEQSKHAAERFLGIEGLDRSGRITALFRHALGRDPTKAESMDAARFLTEFPGEQKEAWTAFCQAIFNTAEFRYVY